LPISAAAARHNTSHTQKPSPETILHTTQDALCRPKKRPLFLFNFGGKRTCHGLFLLLFFPPGGLKKFFARKKFYLHNEKPLAGQCVSNNEKFEDLSARVVHLSLPLKDDEAYEIAPRGVFTERFHGGTVGVKEAMCLS
jgi:hypothetical protein